MSEKIEKNGVLAARPNGRSSVPLVINTPSHRTNLFARPQTKENVPYQRAGDGPLAVPSVPARGGSPSSPRSRIPRPSPQTAPQQTQFRPFGLKEAFRMAQEEEEAAVRGSPSPAPRTWRGTADRGIKNHQKTASQGTVGLGPLRPRQSNPRELKRAGTASSQASPGARSQLDDIDESDIDEKLRKFALEREAAGNSNGREQSKGISSRSKVGLKLVGAGRELTREASNQSLDDDSPTRILRRPSGQNSGWLHRRVPSRKSESARPTSSEWIAGGQSISARPNVDGLVPAARPSTVPPDYPGRTPDKSYVWQADADFTPGELLVSDSPPVKLGRTNTKLDEIRALEVEAFARFPEETRSRPRNTRLDEIRALEIEAAQQFPDDTVEPGVVSDDIEIKKAGTEGDFQRNHPITQFTPKIDEELRTQEIANLNRKAETAEESQRNHQTTRSPPKVDDDLRAREIANLTRRALATSRLDELRERHSEFRSRSTSPELPRKTSKEVLQNQNATRDPVTRSTGSEIRSPGEQGELISNTPITVFKGSDSEHKLNEDAANGTHREPKKDESNQPRSVDSQDLLRRLARAASLSPATEDQPNPEQEATRRLRQKRGEGAKDSRPTVGFAGLPREPSIDSLSSKRSTGGHSETDPTDRIEQELKLFAPAGDQSERGSLRAQSSDSNEDLAEETPTRPVKLDPLLQPTPVMIGAYIETPATIKPTGVKVSPDLSPPTEVKEENKSEDYNKANKDGTEAKDLSLRGPASFRGRKRSSSPRKIKHTLSAKGDRAATRSLSVTAYRRSRSVPRIRSPLINSSKPPTVKDDLLEIHRTHHIDDSTLDDLSELLSSQPTSPISLDFSPKREVKIEKKDEGERINREPELEALDRMSKTLRTGLLGIRTAKQGIERLEDKVSHADLKPKIEPDATAAVQKVESAPRMDQAAATTVTYVRFPVPRLYRRQPRFRFTLLGLLLFLFALWYAAETSMCSLYCKPQYCYPGQPCDWSPDDPFWGYSLPVKLDQWTTGGQGRKLVEQLRPEIADWIADVWDSATGIDIAQIDTTYYDWHQMQSHWRRLLKKGLIEPFVARPEDKEKFAAWEAARIARERVESAREMGISLDDDESMTSDEKVRRR